jgi:hypothetical protein
VLDTSFTSSFNGQENMNRCDSTVNGSTFAIGAGNCLEARAGGYNTPCGQRVSENYYCGVATVIGSSLHTDNFADLNYSLIFPSSGLNGLTRPQKHALTALGVSNLINYEYPNELE